MGALRIWDKKIENGPGLLTTRSIGDLESRNIGVISEPEIQKLNLNDNDLFVVVGTDGF